MSSRKAAVVLVNMGAPRSPEEIEPYLYRIFMDADLIRAPWGPLRPWIAAFISRMRSRKLRAAYARMGNGSPLLRISMEQRDRLQALLNEQFGQDRAQVFLAMRYGHPLMSEVWEEISSQKISRVILLPAYPFYSSLSTGSIVNEARRLCDRYGMSLRVIACFGEAEYAELCACAIRMELDAANGPYDLVILSAHSVPMSSIRRLGDPYAVQTEWCASEIRRIIGDCVELRLGYQSKIGPVSWLGPSTPQLIEESLRSGFKKILVYPLGFVADNLETLYEIGCEYRELAERLGAEKFYLVACPNDSVELIRLWGQLIMRYMDQEKENVE